MEKESYVDKGLLHTAFHEQGHALVAKSLGGGVEKVSIIRDGNILGHTKVNFSHHPCVEKITRFMATLCGGYVAEEMIGVGHWGCSSDMARLDFLAEFASKSFYNGLVSPGKLKSQAYSLARSCLSVFALLEEKSMQLYEKKIILNPF